MESNGLFQPRAGVRVPDCGDRHVALPPRVTLESRAPPCRTDNQRAKMALQSERVNCSPTCGGQFLSGRSRMIKSARRDIQSRKPMRTLTTVYLRRDTPRKASSLMRYHHPPNSHSIVPGTTGLPSAPWYQGKWSV